ncbi:MAG: DUF1549 domain-containing protein [Planctomycetes bacterium]|nr:DUF1549 domain-containing protein [Planctomycetota bacterium]
MNIVGPNHPVRSLSTLLALLLAPMTPAQGTAAAQAQQPSRAVDAVVPAGKIAAAAARIDALLQKGLQRLQVQPLPIVDDATFLRRAYLQLIGRIPNLAETQAFLADAAADKRTRLVDRLLDSPGHTSHETNFWFDLLRVKSRLRQASGEPFAEWIRTAIQNDMPYDQFVREMLVAEGPTQQRGNGATGLLLRDANMPHDAMANTLRVFLGTRLECAQCHDHPFDTWKQKEFYAMAAFFGGLRYRLDARELPAGLAGARQIIAELDERQRAVARNQLQRLTSGIAGSGTGVERLPDDYKYRDARPKDVVAADTLFGDDVKLKRPGDDGGAQRTRNRARERAAAAARRDPEIDSRKALADWLTDADTPRFATVIVNRFWQRQFGRGLIDPVDDLKSDSRAVHPELQQYLEKLLVELKFDLRQFQRVLSYTQVFQRECPTEDVPADKPYAFAGPLLRRMSAEQTWDSLLTLVFADIDQRLRPADARSKELYDRYEQLATADAATLKTLLTDTGRRPATPTPEQMAERRATTAEQQQKARPLIRQLLQARRDGDDAKVRDLAAQIEKLGVPLPGQRAARGREGDLVRASDMAQPAPAGHLLRQFGQSDRESFDGANTAANVPQVLTMLNGFLDQRVLGGQSALRTDLEAIRDPARRLEIAFLTVLNRRPDTAELATWQQAMRSDGDAALRDLVWVLCNSNEFRFIR